MYIFSPIFPFIISCRRIFFPSACLNFPTCQFFLLVCLSAPQCVCPPVYLCSSSLSLFILLRSSFIHLLCSVCLFPSCPIVWSSIFHFFFFFFIAYFSFIVYFSLFFCFVVFVLFFTVFLFYVFVIFIIFFLLGSTFGVGVCDMRPDALPLIAPPWCSG